MTSRSSAFSTKVSLIFEVQLKSGALFLRANSLSYELLSGFVTFIFRLQIHMHHYNHIGQILALRF